MKYSCRKRLMMDTKLHFLLLVITVLGIKGSPDCDTYTDCDTCTRHSSWVGSCRWCPCDQQCHAFGAIFGNQCNSDDDITSPYVCATKSSKDIGCVSTPDCDEMTDCVSCTQHETWTGDHCRWCPCDQQCHAFGALVGNPCNSDDDITNPYVCATKSSRDKGCVSTPDCDEMTDCVSCTQHETWSGDKCRWCPLDRECHAKGSLMNSCRQEQNTVDSRYCGNQMSGIYSPDSAFTNTLLSAVAYSDDPKKCLDTIFPNDDFEIVEVIGRRCERFPLFRYKECFAYIAMSNLKKKIVLAFRGTEFDGEDKSQLIDEIISVLIDPKQSFYNKGEVQVYFKDVHDKIMPCAKQSIKSVIKDHPDYDVVVTGHSLGGAVASLASMTLIMSETVKESKLTLYTFGMPRAGDKGYAFYHDQIVINSWRVVHGRDIVSHLPTCNYGISCRYPADGPYHHGTEVFYRNFMNEIDSQYKICKGDEDEQCSDGLVTDNWCTDRDNCEEDHKNYFNIKVGDYCDERTQRFRRSPTGKHPNVSNMWHLFSEDHCSRIRFGNNSISIVNVTPEPSVGSRAVEKSMSSWLHFISIMLLSTSLYNRF